MTGIELLKIIRGHHLNDAAALILTVDTDKCDLISAKEVLEIVKEEFPDLEVLMMPKYLNLHVVSEFEIISLINTLYTILYKSKKSGAELDQNEVTC